MLISMSGWSSVVSLVRARLPSSPARIV